MYGTIFPFLRTVVHTHVVLPGFKVILRYVVISDPDFLNVIVVMRNDLNYSTTQHK